MELCSDFTETSGDLSIKKDLVLSANFYGEFERFVGFLKNF